jgi:hypothetical protein
MSMRKDRIDEYRKKLCTVDGVGKEEKQRMFDEIVAEIQLEEHDVCCNCERPIPWDTEKCPHCGRNF